MPSPSYIIATKLCTIPHIIDPLCVESLNKDIKIYMDDILYKDSAYDKGVELSIKEFCSISSKVCIAFRDKPKTLVSRRGHYRLNKEKYEKLLKTLSPDYHADFDSGKLLIEDQEVVEPANVEDFVRMMNQGHLLFGTEFINNLVADGQMLKLEKDKVSVNDIFDCSCCGALPSGYLKYLWDIKEMNASTYLTIHNYNVLDDIMKAVGSGKINAKDLRI